MSETGSMAADGAPPTMTIDIVSDVVCPWCYIGKRRLEAALAVRGGPAPTVHWHPFQLNPDIPAGGVDRRSYLQEKFGGPERAREIYARVEAVGREVGIPFKFELIERQPNTIDTHRLIAWTQVVAPEHVDRLVERLFEAYFTEGADIGAVDVLTRLAGEAGGDPVAARTHLESGGGREEITAADARVKSIGISGVPFFILNRRLAVSGAQPPDVLGEALQQAEQAT